MFSLGMVKALIIHLWVKKKKNKKFLYISLEICYSNSSTSVCLSQGDNM